MILDYRNFTALFKEQVSRLASNDQAMVLPIDKLKIAERAEQVEAITPHMDDYGDYIGSYALNACQSVYYSLQFLITNDYINIFYIGTSLTDTIDFKVQEDNELTEEQIDSHPEMIEVRNYLIGVTANINV